MKVTEEDFPGIPTELAAQLKKIGYPSLKSLALATEDELIHDLNISSEMAVDLINKGRSLISVPPVTADQLLEDEYNRGKLTTSSNNLDSLLEGGVWEKEITEIAGGFATGKSQICFQLSVNAQLPRDRGGLEGKVFFVDTEGTFSAKRVGELAIAHDLDPREVLSNIFVARVLDSTQQFKIIKKVSEMAEKENIKLVIVDSLAAHFRADYIGKNKLVERQQKIMQQATLLSTLAFTQDLAVVVTNQVIARVDEFASSTSDQPALGQAWAHRPQTRLLLRKSPGLARIARLLDSPRRPEGEEIFYITPVGIRDKPHSGF
ncbi:MAG: DNA repair and recombination protein RadA [Methanobacteriota archaeon]|nr:MAG: DNA repair and recombination protein RadA [Euryarchaeota archaeon]